MGNGKPADPAPAKKTNNNAGLLIGGGVALGVVLIALALVIYCYLRQRKKNSSSISKKEMRRKMTRTKVVTKAPEIKVNAIEFTVPTKKTKHRVFEGKEYGDESLALIKTQERRGSGHSTASEVPSEAEEGGIKTAYGLLRPDLYISDSESTQDEEEYPPMHIGRVWFRLEYDCETENLLVTLIKVKYLAARQQRGSLSMSGSSTCDPFVRIYLLPDEKRYLQSKMKKKTRNPTFNQTFAFSMSYAMLCERTLRFTVFDVDRFMRQTVIGHALYSLDKLDITVPMEEFTDLERSALPISDSIGELFVNLTFFSGANKMAVTVSRAINLQHPDFATLNPYLKITHSVLGKVMKTKKTPVHRETSDANFDFCFEFKINPDVLEKTCFTIEVMHNTSPVLKHDKLIGRVDIGGPLVSSGKVLDHWSSAISRSNSPVKDWHYLKR